MKDKMLDWNEENDTIEGPNKLIEINKHIEGIIKPSEYEQNPYGSYKKHQMNTVGNRATTSPNNIARMGPEVAYMMKDISDIRSRSVMRARLTGVVAEGYGTLSGLRS